jgi:hypothetical protein
MPTPAQSAGPARFHPARRPPADSSFKHLTVAPDGTLILKNQCRPTGNTQQGSLAIFKGLHDGLKQAPSIFAAVDPESLEVLDVMQMPEPATTPHGITMFDGRIAIYTCADAHAYRYFWDPESKKLSLDEAWAVPYLAEGQTTGDAPGIMGDWITIQTNGVGANVPSTVVAINQHDPGRITAITPFGPLKRRQRSIAPPKTCTDAENGMLYSADLGVGKVAGLRLDQETGALTTCQVRLVHELSKIHATFDDPNLVSRAGLVPVMALAQRAGLGELVDGHVRPGRPCGVNAHAKVPCLVAGMSAGADSIDDLDLLRHGAMGALFGGVRAPSTLGSFLRSFTWGNVLQLEKVSRLMLAELARQAPLLPGKQTLAFVDIDSMQKRVYGRKKQGAAFGHTKIQGKSLLVRGLNALAATR